MPDGESGSLSAAAREGDAEPRSNQNDLELLRLRQALEASGEAVILTDRAGLITYVNPEFTDMYGYGHDEVVGATTPRVLKSGRLTDQDYELFWQTLLSRRIYKGEIVNRCKDGRLITVESSANAVVDRDGRIIGFLAIQRDITARKEAERKLMRRNRELAILNTVAGAVNRSLDLNSVLENALAEVLQLDIFSADAKGMVLLLDKSSGRLSVVSHQGAPEDHPCLQKPITLGECLCGLAAQKGTLIVCEDNLADARHSRHPAVGVHCDVCLPLKAHGKILGVMNVRLPAKFTIVDEDRQLLGSVADQIALAVENAMLFEAVSAQRRRLKALAARTADAEEAERRRLSRELHDQIGQNLSAIGLNLTIIGALMEEGTLKDGFARLEDTRELVEYMAEQIRSLMVELRPPILDDYGLLAALRWYGVQTRHRTGLRVKVESTHDNVRLDSGVEIALFRIAQEALNNVIKHAQATEVTITIGIEDAMVRMQVRDDGLGFDAQRPDQTRAEIGWGTLIMAERAEALGGSCRIETDPVHGGTVVVTQVPQ